jgi:serine/threonine protein kinase/tetratricopeptide (TPR) repeat protein
MSQNPSDEIPQPGKPNSTDPVEIARRHRVDPPDLERLPERIGPYKILANLGVGGMGIVYLGEQATPFRRVAIKIISPLRRSKEILARFDIEREALALMDHPNIARVYDAGEADDGRPYFVMEYVHGIPITEYCDKNKLTTDERLRLFVEVCRAVHHAHQKGIIHRDIKPGNVLVAVQEDRPIVKVIDFGVAKAVQQRLTEKTIFTEHGQLIGTPGYMSPEQAEMSALDIDTRTDIYSLGVLLYELLVGAQPFDVRKLLDAGFGEIQRFIREVDPPKPSTRLSSLGDDSTVVATNRGTVVRHLSREVRGDLDWITMKCLEKDRMHRYDSAAALADDIERHRRSEPVLAGPPSVVYKLRKFTRRHRFGVLAGSGVAAALLAGFLGTAVQYVEKSRQFDRAEREAATTREVSDFLVDLFEVTDPGESLGRTIPVREILDRGAVRIRTELGNRPLVRAAMLHTIGKVYTNLGLYKEADELLREAVEIRRREHPTPHDDTAASLHHLGVALERQEKFEEAEALHQEGLKLREALHGRRHTSTADSLSHVAILDFHCNRRNESLALQKEVLEIHRSLLPPEDARIASSLAELGRCLSSMGETVEAQRHFEHALQIIRQSRPGIHPETTRWLLQLAFATYANGDHPSSHRYHSEALEGFRLLYGVDSIPVSRCLNSYAALLAKDDDVERAEGMAREAMAINVRRIGPQSLQVASDLNLLGAILRKKKDFGESERLHRESLAIRLEKTGPAHELTAVSRLMLGVSLGEAGRFEEAESELLEALRVLEAYSSPGRLPDAYKKTAAFYRLWGKPDKETHYERLAEP